MGYFFLLPWNRPSRNPPLQRFKHVERQARANRHLLPACCVGGQAATDAPRRRSLLPHNKANKTYLPMVGLEPTISSLGGRRLIH